MRGDVTGLLAAALLAAGPGAAQEGPFPAGTYLLDPAHASLMFSVSHLGFSDYVMSFDRFEATLEIDPEDPGAARVEAWIDPASLDLPTPPEGFLEELLGESWLDVAAHPQIGFVSERVDVAGDATVEVHGVLILLGAETTVILGVTFNGGYAGHPFDPNARIGFSAEAVFDRSAFGLTFGIPAQGSTMGVGDAVTVRIEAEFTGPPFEPADG